MRTIELSPPDDPSWLRWIGDCEAASAVHVAAVERGDSPTFDDQLCRRRKIRDMHFFSGEHPFFGKCVYCESTIDLMAGDIDHFRPKAEVCDEAGQPVYTGLGTDAPRKHPGYYWLAYEWKNLFPCCRLCNRSYKRARFPVEGEHATSPAEVVNERPLLIDPSSEHPEDRPDRHLAVHRDGSIGGKTYRGAATVRILGLNRGSLRTSRAHAYFAAIGIWTHLHQGSTTEREEALRRLRRIRDGREPHFLAQQAALAEMEAKAGS